MWGFLANLGSGLSKIGSSFARGATSAGKGVGQGLTSVGKGIGRGFRRLGDLGEDDLPLDQPSAPTSQAPIMTPPFNPNAGRGVDIIEGAVADAENNARAKLPILPGITGGNMPELSPAPSLAELRSSLPILPEPRKVTPAAAPAPPGVVASAEALAPKMDLDRRNLPIPRLPGHAGGPVPFNPIDAAKYDSVMEHAKRDAEGNLIPMTEGGGFKRDLGMTLKNAFLAASAAARSAGPGEDPLGRALGGALTGGVGSAINPQAGYEFAFDYGERPKLEAEQAREQAARDRANLEIFNRAKLEGTLAETEERRARTDKTRADVDIGRSAEERARLMDESQRRLNEAKMLAELTGVERVEDIFNPQTGAFERVAIFPGGKTQVIGSSGEAEMKRREISSREKISREGEAAATGRTAMTQAGEDKRAQMRIDAERELAAGGDSGGLKRPSAEGGKSATMSKLREFYKAKGITDDAEIRRRAKEHGFTVKD